MKQQTTPRLARKNAASAVQVTLPVRFRFGDSGPVLLTLLPRPPEFRGQPRARFRVLVRTTWPADGNPS